MWGITWSRRLQIAAALVGLVLIAIVVRSAMTATHPSQATVGSYFDDPPQWPGQPWTRNGTPLSRDVIEAAGGPPHCGWQSVTLLTIGWPPGAQATSAGQAHHYVRDTGHVLSNALRGTWEHNPTLPLDAVDTGFRYGAVELFFSFSDEDRYAYLVAPADSERWPRGDPMALCE